MEKVGVMLWYDSEAEKAAVKARVFTAMMKMTKFDIATIEAAAKG